MRFVQRLGIQLPQARCIGRPQKSNDLAREAVSWNAGLGSTAFALSGCATYLIEHARERLRHRLDFRGTEVAGKVLRDPPRVHWPSFAQGRPALFCQYGIGATPVRATPFADDQSLALQAIDQSGI